MLKIDGNSLTISDVLSVCEKKTKVCLDEKAKEPVKKSRDFIEKIIKEKRVVYGVNTGLGELSNTVIPADKVEKLQINLIRSHSVNVGEPFEENVVRGIILLRANALAKGFSGVRILVIELLISLLNKNIYPYIPKKGSVGASGDLSPLSHLALAVIGEGECIVDGKRTPSGKVLKKAGLKPLTLKAKEGLALINGTQVMSALGCIIVDQSISLVKCAQIAGAMSLEALKGTSKSFDEKIHAIRPHPGQIKCASNMRKIVKGSKIILSHADCDAVQDAYTLRCIPQVLGAVMDAISSVSKVLEIEINSATDNPLVFAEHDECISGGNFHGEPLAFAMDYLGMALAEIANLSERTIDRLVNPHVSGLPAFLVEKSGLNSGFMIAQYTAAALVSENKVLAHPACVDSIPTSAGQEDHVSMGSISAKHAWDILSNVQHVLSIEMLCAAQGIDFWDYEPGEGTRAAHLLVRKHVQHYKDDRVMYKDMEKIHKLIVTKLICQEVENVTGKLD